MIHLYSSDEVCRVAERRVWGACVARQTLIPLETALRPTPRNEKGSCHEHPKPKASRLQRGSFRVHFVARRRGPSGRQLVVSLPSPTLDFSASPPAPHPHNFIKLLLFITSKKSTEIVLILYKFYIYLFDPRYKFLKIFKFTYQKNTHYIFNN